MTTRSKRLFLLIGIGFIAIALITVGLNRHHGGTPSAQTSADTKVRIYKSLASKTGQKDFRSDFDFDLPNQVTLMRSNAHVLEQRGETLRASIREIEEQTAPLRKELEQLRNETLDAKRAVAELKARVKAAETDGSQSAKAISALQSDCAKNDQAWMAKRQQTTEKETQINTVEGRVSPFAKQLEEVEKELQAARKELSQKEDELSAQENVYIRQMRQRVSEARDYKAIYFLIAQQLMTADKLLADANAERRRIGISFAREACRHAGDVEDIWLSARICEAYFWPSLDFADYAAGSKERAQDLLQTCKSVFSTSEETNNVLRTYDLMIANASTVHAADSVRLELASFLEQSGDDHRAVALLSEIKDSELLKTAEEKAGQIKQRLSASQ